jgi:prepilin-type N-terminal cleavage/methylation domain-containing protein
MKKAFSLMEVIISVVILSVVMIALLQIKSENIHIVSKSDDRVKNNDHILMAINFDEPIFEKKEIVYIDKKFNYLNEKIRTELDSVKIEIKDEKKELKSIKTDSNSINVTTYNRTFLENGNIKKKLYSFKIEL